MFGLSGTSYSGQFNNGVIHGQGLLRKTNGEQYEGSWVNGKKEGTCTCTRIYIIFICVLSVLVYYIHVVSEYLTETQTLRA